MARTKIILILEEQEANAKKIAQETALSYASILYHLHLLRAEQILSREGKRPYVWKLTGAGQQRLADAPVTV